MFILRPTSARMWHKAVFKVGPIAEPKPNTTGSSKNSSGPIGIPLFGGPQVPNDKPNPSEEGYSLGVKTCGTHPNKPYGTQPQPVECTPPLDTMQRHFGLILWDINYCRLFKATFYLFIYIKYMISKHILSITFLNEPGLILLHTVK